MGAAPAARRFASDHFRPAPHPQEINRLPLPSPSPPTPRVLNQGQGIAKEGWVRFCGMANQSKNTAKIHEKEGELTISPRMGSFLPTGEPIKE
jgi:hypothetical protein